MKTTIIVCSDVYGMYSDYFRMSVSGEIVRNSGISNNWFALKHYQIPFRTLPAHCWPRCKTSTTRKKHTRACEMSYIYIIYICIYYIILYVYRCHCHGIYWWTSGDQSSTIGDLTEDEVRIPGLQWLMFNQGRVVETQRLIDPSSTHCLIFWKKSGFSSWQIQPNVWYSG